MPEPTDKAPEIDALISRIMGKDRKDTVKKSACMTCTDPNMTFRDELSMTEYGISGMCQDCQDQTFRP